MAVLSTLLCTGQCFGFVSQTVEQSIILFHTTGRSSIQRVICDAPLDDDGLLSLALPTKVVGVVQHPWLLGLKHYSTFY